jgi:hypothetical protein
MIGLTGVQSLAKDVLEPLGKAQKAPLANLGVLLPFATTMLKERLGMADKPSLAWAPAPLRPAAEMIESATAAFGSAVRDLAIKHRKGILEQQLQVQRVADVVIDITAASATLSRAAKAYESNAASAPHEVAIANLFAEEAKHRIAANLRGVRGGTKALDKLKMDVAVQVLEAGAYIPAHPTGI